MAAARRRWQRRRCAGALLAVVWLQAGQMLWRCRLLPPRLPTKLPSLSCKGSKPPAAGPQQGRRRCSRPTLLRRCGAATSSRAMFWSAAELLERHAAVARRRESCWRHAGARGRT